MGIKDNNDDLLPVYIDNQKYSLEDLSSKFKREYQDLMYEFFMNLNKKTAETYRIDLKQFFKFTTKNFKVPAIGHNGIQFNDVKRIHVIKWRNYLQSDKYNNGRPAASQTVIKKLSAIKTFWFFLMDKDMVKDDITSGVKRPKQIILRETAALDDNEVVELFDLVDKINSKAYPLHKSLIVILFTTGIREHSLRHLKLKDLKEDIGFQYFEFIGKKEKKHRVPLLPQSSYYLKQYLEWMQQQNREVKKDDYIFQATKGKLSGTGAPISKEGLRWIVKKYASKISDKYISGAHIARATVISSLLENGADIYRVSQMVQHSSTNTTRGYDKRTKKLKDSPIFDLKFFKGVKD